MIIHTARLVLRPITLSDFDIVHAYAADPETTRYMMRLPNETPAETEAFLRGAQAEWQKDTPAYYEFAVTLDGVQIGAVSIYPDECGEWAELGWLLARPYWHNGYASEAAGAIVRFARDTLHLRRLIARCDARNTASARVMQRIGMTLTDDRGSRTYEKRDETACELTYTLVFS